MNLTLSTSIRLWFEHRLQWVKTIFSLKGGLIFLLFVLLVIFVAVMFSEIVEAWIGQLLGLSDKNKTLTFLGIGMGGILLALQALASYKRAKAMEDTAKEQANAVLKTEQGQRQERLKNAIEHLGHQSDSVRLGGAYELFHLAKDTRELCQTVLDILCAHIRRTTGESKYRKEHKSKPSEEVQSLLTLLFVEEYEVFKGLGANLQGSWLNGAALRLAQLQGAVLSRAQLQGAWLWKAQLQGAELSSVQLQGANLFEAQLQGANLLGAQLQGVVLWKAQLQGAVLHEAQLQEADLSDAQLQGAELWEAQLQTIENITSSLLEPFEYRIKRLIGKKSDLSSVVFVGGLSRKVSTPLSKACLMEKQRICE